MTEIRYAKRSVQIDGRVFNKGDIIPTSITDEAAKLVHAFDEASIEVDSAAAVADIAGNNDNDGDDEETITIIEEPVEVEEAIVVEGAELIQSDEAVAPVAPEKPAKTRRGAK